MRVVSRVTAAVGVIALGALAGAAAGERAPGGSTAADAFLKRYTAALRVLLDRAPQPVSPEDLVSSSLDGALATLDPHSSYLRPEAFAGMRERHQGSFYGIGVIISVRGGRVTVITPVDGTPAARVGLRAGDVIAEVDGTPTADLDLDEVAQRLRGPEGTTVRVTVERVGLEQPLALEIERGRVPSDSVRYAFRIGQDVAYIRIADFTQTTGTEVRRHFERLQQEGATRLVLDLRDNPGGIVDSSVEVASVLLEPGQLVFSTKGRTADSFQDYRAARDGLHFSGPVVVLVNRGSASAAEIVAGAVQDHDRGLIVGENTFGKGVVQTIYPVRDAGLALTTAKYYTPSGRCIQRDFDSYFTYIRHAEDDQAPPAGEVFFTDAGRKVYGGGGIVPDHEVSLTEVSQRIAQLLGNSAFFQFAVSYLSDKTDKAATARAFAVTPEVVEQFRARVLAEKWLDEPDLAAALADEHDRQDIDTSLRAEVLNAGVGLSAGYEVFTAADEQVQAALQLFDEADRLNARGRVARVSESAARNRTLAP
jgi:carboxyl-terminal processing protease